LAITQRIYQSGSTSQ